MPTYDFVDKSGFFSKPLIKISLKDFDITPKKIDVFTDINGITTYSIEYFISDSYKITQWRSFI